MQKHLPARWQALVTRDNKGMPSRRGQVWASPYRWGCTLIAYRKGDLLRSALSHTISLPDDPFLAALLWWRSFALIGSRTVASVCPVVDVLGLAILHTSLQSVGIYISYMIRLS